jgi:hypothetical protein
LTEKLGIVMDKVRPFGCNDSIFMVYSLSVSSFISDIISVSEELRESWEVAFGRLITKLESVLGILENEANIFSI